MELQMADYIVCHKKRNSPRLHIRFCQEKCIIRDDCKDYLNHLNVPPKENQATLSGEHPPLDMVAP